MQPGLSLKAVERLSDQYRTKTRKMTAFSFGCKKNEALNIVQITQAN